MEFREYNLMLKASRYKSADKQREQAFGAWLGALVKGRKKNGKPVYETFKDFFDYDGIIKEIDKEEIKVNKDLARMKATIDKVNKANDINNN